MRRRCDRPVGAGRSAALRGRTSANCNSSWAMADGSFSGQPTTRQPILESGQAQHGNVQPDHRTPVDPRSRVRLDTPCRFRSARRRVTDKTHGVVEGILSRSAAARSRWGTAMRCIGNSTARRTAFPSCTSMAVRDLGARRGSAARSIRRCTGRSCSINARRGGARRTRARTVSIGRASTWTITSPILNPSEPTSASTGGSCWRVVGIGSRPDIRRTAR